MTDNDLKFNNVNIEVIILLIHNKKYDRSK